MSFCNNSNSIVTINPSECLGNSLVAINANFETLKQETCSQSDVISVASEQKNELNTNILSLSSTLKFSPTKSVKFDKDCNKVNHYGIGNIIKNSTGFYKVEFAPPFINTNYLAIGSTISDNSCFVSIIDQTISYITIKIRNSEGNLITPNFINLFFFS